MCGKPIRFIDLFAGIGSFHYSFIRHGLQCVAASDICPPAKATYQHNFGLQPLGDIKDIDPSKLPQYDILCAGFPCQAFSQAGHHKGFDDDRGTMFFQVMRLVAVNNPRVIVLENVPALLTHDNGNTFTVIKEQLTKEGYQVIHKVLKCCDYGIPQMRKRVFIICYKNITTRNINHFFDLSKYKKKVTLSDYLGLPFDKETAYTIRCGGKNSPINDRHNWDGYMVGGKEYRLTIEDGLRLQGFENYTLLGTKIEKWKLLGNTIPTVFTDIICQQLLEHFVF